MRHYIMNRNTKVMLARIKKLRRIGWKTKWLAVQYFFLTGIVRLLLLKVPFKKIQPYIGEHNKESALDRELKEYEEAKKIKRVVEVVSSYTPWESKCLVQAIVAQYLLKRRHISTTLYLGVCRDEIGELKAHAWLRCGKLIVTGERSKTGYKEVSKFSNEYTLQKVAQQYKNI